MLKPQELVPQSTSPVAAVDGNWPRTSGRATSQDGAMTRVSGGKNIYARLVYVEGQLELLRRQLPPGPQEHFVVLDEDDVDPWEAQRLEFSDGW